MTGLPGSTARRYGTVFDEVAAEYDRHRPAYPDELVDQACRAAGIGSGDHVLEVGCGSGQLTSGLVARGLHVTAVEPGKNLIALARQNLEGAGEVEFVNAQFEDAVLPREQFQAVFSASAFHWIDPKVSWQKAADVLVPGGTLALIQYCGLEEPRTKRDQEAALATRLFESEVLHEVQRSTGNQHVSGPLPADLRVNPVKRGSGEHGLKPFAGKQRHLKLSVHKFHLTSTFQVLPGECYEALAGFKRCHVQAPSDKAARQLTASAPDLKHMVTGPDPCHLTSLVDELVRVSRTATVVLSRDLIKNLAVTTCGRFWQPCHLWPPFREGLNRGRLAR